MRAPAALAASLLILALSGCSDQPEAPARTPDAAREVAVAESIERAVPAGSYAGTVTAVREIPVAARLGAHVREVRVREGDTVKKGDVLIVLDDADLKSVLVQAESESAAAALALKDAETDFAKFQGLFREEAASEAELRKARLARDQAMQLLRASEARLAQARERVADAEITAPEDSRVFAVRAEPGMLAAPGIPLVMLESLDGLLFEIHVPVSVLPRLNPGARALVRLDGRPEAVGAKVLRSVQSADRLSRTGMVKLEFPSGLAALPGEFGRAEFPDADSETGVWVGERHIASRGGLSGVFAIRDGRARFHWLRLGRRTSDGFVQVLAGLSAGERIVAEPPASLYDGDRVKPMDGSAK